MKCYSHREVEAVAICVRCGKAVCSECENESETHRITCSQACGEAAARHDVLRTAFVEQYAAAARSYRGLTIVAGISGLVVVLFAMGGLILDFLCYGTSDPVLLGYYAVTFVLGSVFLLGSRFLRRIAKKYEDIKWKAHLRKMATLRELERTRKRPLTHKQEEAFLSSGLFDTPR